MTISEFFSYLRSQDVKLWLEGERLRYSAPTALSADLLQRLSERKTEIISFLREVNRSAQTTTAQSIFPASREAPPPLSFAQERLWIFDQLNPHSAVYNIPGAIRLSGQFNLAALQHSFDAIIIRHEVLRTGFALRDGQPVQDIHAHAPLSIPLTDLTPISNAQRAREAARLSADESRQPFDLSVAPLLRVRLLRFDADDHLLLVTMHHIISDGWSIGILGREFAQLYESFLHGKPASLPPLPIQYADFAIWQRAWLSREVLEQQLSYWKAQLGGALPVLEMPTDRPRPPVQTFKGARQQHLLPRSLTDALNELSRREGATLFMTLLAAFKVLLHRYTNQDDILVGTPIANRNRAEIEGLIGFFVNTLVLRTQLSGDPPFLELLKRVRDAALASYAHQDVPFEKLIEELQPPRDASRPPVFQAMFVLQNTPSPELSLRGLTLQVSPVENDTAKFDLTLEVIETAQGLATAMEYNTDLFDAATITRLLEHYHALLDGIVANPVQTISSLPMLPEAERRIILDEWSRARKSFDAHACLHELFERQAGQSRTRTALVFQEERLTYGELNNRANGLAHHLRSLGVGAETLVGVYMERGVELVVGLLGILKAGGAYVPLDPVYPPERLRFMLEDAGVSVILTQQKLLEHLPPTNAYIITLDAARGSIDGESVENPSPLATPGNLAYIIYTSGSTGKPKGTMVTHANVVRLFKATESWFNFGAGDVWTLFHSYAFDFSVWELWGALLYGGRLVVVPHIVSRSPEAFRQMLLTEGVTVLNQTPSAFRQLMRLEESKDNARAELDALRLVVFGGEALEMQSLKPWFERYGDESPQLINMYGITETTVHVTYRPLRIEDAGAASRSFIGAAIPDLEIFLLDGRMQPVAVGVAGEIHVGGAGLARGYLARPELTAQRFVPHPFSARPGARLYKTGDLGRFLPNGEIEYLGRIDLQVKIRGFRIELGEIEAVLGQHETVRETVVVARQAGDEKMLAAYVVAARPDTAIDVSELRGFLREKLPDYMIPATFVTLTSLPLTAHGKVDYRALPEPETARPQVKERYIAPRTATEQAFAEIWQEVLRLERVGIDDNFFELGGDSIRSIRVHAGARERGLNFSVQQLFRHSTIRELASAIADTADGNGAEFSPHAPTEPFSLVSPDDRARLPADVEDAYPLAMLQAGMFFHSQFHPGSAVYHNITSLHLRSPFDRLKLEDALRQLFARHPVLRTSFDLVNYSEPLQLVHRSVRVPLEVEDLSSLPEAQRAGAIDDWFEAEKARDFDWSRAPLIRFHVHLRSQQTFQLSWTEHHAILDGWSVASMMTELFEIYFSSVEETPRPPEPPLTATFRDFVSLEREIVSHEPTRQFWLEKLADASPTLMPRWPSAYRSREVRQHALRVPVPVEVSEGLKRLSSAAGAPLKSVLLAAHLRVFATLGGRRDVTTGIILNGRIEEADGERVLGLFLNTLPLRLRMRGGSWLDLVRETFEAEQELLPSRRFPLAELQRLAGGQQLFETTFNFVNFHVYQNLKGLKDIEFLDTKVFADTNFAFRATFSLDLFTSDVQLELGYLISELSDEQVRSIGDYYAKTLSAMARDLARRYESFSPLATAERERLLVGWNDTEADFAPDTCIHHLLEAQAEQTPEAVAARFEDETLTYGELNRRADILARRLQARGVGADALVGLYAQRSLEMIVGVLAILKAGAAYVPLDPQQPRERLAYILADTGVSLILTQKELAPALPPHAAVLIYLDDPDEEETGTKSVFNLARAATPRNLAYVIYTSGSTGRPKGILVEHLSLVNYVQGIARRLQLDGALDFVMVQPLTVDASLTALYPPLMTGGCVHVISQERATDPRLLSDYFDRHHIDVLKIAPSHLAALQNWVEPERLMPRRWLVMGGEAPRREWVERLQKAAPECGILNQYGPTEATVAMLAFRFDGATHDDDSLLIPMGRPLPRTQAYVLDEFLQPVPVGVVGELYIGGDCLSRGYLNRPDLTAESFIPNPFSDRPGARLYKTGDLARYLPDGNIMFIGRADDQVKIRGYRVELGEIEAMLGQHPSVEDAAVSAREDVGGEKRLVAYVVPAAGAAPPVWRELQSFLKERLPDYMLPSAFMSMESMPRTSHGKLNRRALPAPEAESGRERESFTPPRDLLEAQLAQIWESTLNVSPVGIRDNFFELGGHSILAVNLTARIQKHFRQDIPLAALLQRPTIEDMAAMLREQTAHRNASPLVGIQTEGWKQPFFCVHPVGGNVLTYFALAQRLGKEQPFYALQSVDANGDEQPSHAPATRIEDMAAAYLEAIREVQQHGPYLLGGWSMGGAVAFEMAQQLRRRGEQASLVVLIDTRLPQAERDGEQPSVGKDGEKDAELLVRFFLDLCGLYGRELSVSFDELRRLKEEELLRYLLEQATQQGIVPPEWDAGRFDSMLRMYEANRRALHLYVPASYDGRVVLFRASDGDASSGGGIEDAWRKVAELLEVQIIEGDHYRLVAEPHVQQLAERIKTYLEEAQTAMPSFRR